MTLSMELREHPYARFVDQVRKPSQYLGGEHGQQRKDWTAVACRMCLAFPDLYEIGMSHLGYRILYDILNGHPKLLAERAYAVWHDMEAQLREHDEPLRSLESARPLRDFDVVGFSLQYELTYTNILSMLELGEIPRYSRERGDDDPLIVAGGPSATHAEPIAPFVDAFLIGDGEQKTPELCLTWAALRDAGVPRRQRLIEIAKLGGFYVPSLYHRTVVDGRLVVDAAEDEAPLPVRRAIVRDLKKHPFPAVGPVASTETIFDRVSIEVARGCTEGCRFCQAGMIYRPVRERAPEDIIGTIERAIREGGYDEASLTSLSTADYSAIQPLIHEVINKLEGKQVNVSVSSLRAYGLSERVLDDMQRQRAGGLTFAPEAGTQRMRDVVNKNVTEEQLLETAERVFSRGWVKMKLYFMIGLPTEEDEDVLGIVATGRRTQAVADRIRGRRDARVTVSVSTHVPKPHTPFQWCAMDSFEEVVRKQQVLRDSAKEHRVKLRMHNSRGSWLEGVLARGDARLAEVIEAAYLGGARFDSWDEQLNHRAWDDAFAQSDVDPQVFLGTIPVDARVPWDHLDVGLEDGFLAREYRKALKNRLSPPCGKAVGQFVHPASVEESKANTKRLVCYDCGIACDMSSMREDRLVALRTLGAEKRLLGSPAPNTSASDASTPKTTQTPEATTSHPPADRRPMLSVEQGEPVKVRIAFRKVGRAAYTGHLDLVRLFPRMFRRAGLPLFYSEGYNPKPKMVFGPALGLGIASLRETCDVKLRGGELDEQLIGSMAERLRAASFEGIEILDAIVLTPKDRGANKHIDEAWYVAGLPQSSLEALTLNKVTLPEHVAARREQPLHVRRRRKLIAKTIDVGHYLVDVNVGAGAETLQAAGIVGDLLPVRFGVRMTDDGSAKPTEVLRALLGEDVPARLVREGLFKHHEDQRIDLMDLPSLRACQ